MATTPIRVLIVDDIPETREHLAKLLSFEPDIEVVAAAASGPEAIDAGVRLLPDIVLMDINMPGMDGIAATEQLSSRVPGAAVIMMSVQGEADYLRRSMLAGAREFLVKPFSSDELAASIRQVHLREREKLGRMVQRAGPGTSASDTLANEGRGPGMIVTVFSPKGGVGRTTIAVNLAVAAQEALKKRVALVDASLQFGDVGVLLNLDPRAKSIADLVPEMGAGEPESPETALVTHGSGVEVILAPPTPETAELITATYLRGVLERLRRTHDLVVVDAWPWVNDLTLAVLDVSDVILTVFTLEITAIKNLRLFFEVADQLGYESGKVKLVLNRADSTLGIRVADVEHSVGRKVDYSIVSDGRTVVYALNRGVPFVSGNRDSAVSRDILNLARAVCGEQLDRETTKKQQPVRRSLFAWR
jgi:pilus assembly protein CpaE